MLRLGPGRAPVGAHGTRALLQLIRRPHAAPFTHHARQGAPARRRPRCSASGSRTQTPEGLQLRQWTGAPHEVQALEALRRAMAVEPYELPPEETLRWFLLDRSFDVAEAREKLVAMLRWRREFGADFITVTDVAREAATGKAVLHRHRDRLGRPVILVRASRHVIGQAPLVESERLCVHLLDRALAELEAEGAARRTVLGVFDMRGFTTRNADLSFVRFLVNVFFVYYPKRLSQVLLVDTPWVFRPGWELVRPWLKKYAALVRFVTAEEVRREYFTPETCPEEFRDKPFLR